jgi:hypothetical protein
MLAKGFSNDLIMELTGLTSDEIAKLKPTNWSNFALFTSQ